MGLQEKLNQAKGRERGTSGQGDMRQKRARVAGLKGLTGTCGVG